MGHADIYAAELGVRETGLRNHITYQRTEHTCYMYMFLCRDFVFKAEFVLNFFRCAMSDLDDIENDGQADGLQEGQIDIADVVRIRVGGRKKDWFSSLSVVDGHRFVHLEKWDRVLVHLCTGKTLQLHKTLGYFA